MKHVSQERHSIWKLVLTDEIKEKVSLRETKYTNYEIITIKVS